ncbi:MAG: T9SS type A sorting domain-containing protein [Chitinophagaceae bacterium]
MKFFTFRISRIFVLVLLLSFQIDMFGQATDDFRSAQTGNWNNATTWERYNGTSWVALGAFPVVGSTNSSAQATASTTHVVNLPSGIQSGDLLLIFWVDANTSGTNPTTPTGFTLLNSSTQNSRYRAVWYKVANGTEGATINVTGGNEKSAHNSYRIVAGTYSGVPVTANANTGNTMTPNPPSTTSGFGVVNTLWIASAHSAGDGNAITSPTSYTDQVSGYSGTAGDADARMVTARRFLNAAAEDPGTFTSYSVNRQWAAFTVAISPVTTFPTSTNNVITVRNTHTVTVTANVSIDQCTIESGGQVTVNAGQTLTVANGSGTDLTVNGTLVNSNTITTTGTVAFNANSVYQHARNGGVIPTATWNTTSSCNITGITGTAPTGLNQAFGNFTWDCIGQTTGFLFAEALSTINGNFTVGITNSFGLYLASTNNTTYTLTVGGNLTINNNGWLSLLYGQGNNAFGDNIIGTINVGGNFSMSGANSFFDYLPFQATGGGLSLNKLTLNVAGNYSQSGGIFNFAAGNSDVSNFTELKLAGDFSLTGTGSIITSTGSTNIGNGTITFNKAGIQTVNAATPTNLTYTNFIVAANSTVQLLSSIILSSSSTPVWGGNFTVNSGGILDAGTNQIVSSSGLSLGQNNSFTLNGGAGILTANVNGVHQIGFVGPTISAAIATRTFSSTANYTYNGTAIQNSGTFVTTPTANEVNNLTLNNTAGNTTTGVTLQQPIAVAGVLTLSSGHITTDATNLLTMNAGSSVSGANYGVNPKTTSGGDNVSFVNGPMRKIGNTNFLFPVGKLIAGHHPCGISAPANLTDAFTAEYMRNTAYSQGPITATGLSQISNCEFWNITRTAGTSAVDVTLTWNGIVNCNAATYVNDITTLRIVHNNGSWSSFGGSTDPGSAAPLGSITWSGVNTFSPFTLGSTSAATNPLPVTLVNVKAYRNGSSNKIEWTNLTESDVTVYEVQRSVNGTAFVTISSLEARSNTSSREDYMAVYFQNSPVTYYRIKVKGIDGKVVYSPVVKVAGNNQLQADMVVYPNPVTGKQVTLQLNSPAGNYTLRVFAANGQVVKTETIIHPGGSYSKTIELPGQLPAGHYYLQVTGGEQVLNSKLIIQ